jgi:hypothetical protein
VAPAGRPLIGPSKIGAGAGRPKAPGVVGFSWWPRLATLVRLRYCPETKAYIQRRQADGLSKCEAIRCVKRYVARQTYHAMRTDLAA